MRSPDYKKSLKYLDGINKFIKEQCIAQDFYFEGYNFWASYQMKLFGEFKEISFKNENEILKSLDKSDKESLGTKIKVFILNMILLKISLISFFYYLFSRPKMLVYSIDKVSDKINKRDSRVSFIYDFIKSEKIKTLEIMHTIPNMQTLRNFWSRKEPVIYLESVYFLASLFSSQKATKPSQNGVLTNEQGFENKLFLSIIERYKKRFEVSNKMIKILYKVLSFFDLKDFWGIDDARNINEIVFLCKNNKIKSTIFQHGHITKYHTGWLAQIFKKEEIIKADKFVVWSEYWKKELIRLNSYYGEKEIVVGGEKKVINFSHKTRKYDICAVLIPYETDAPKEEVQKYINKLQELNIKVYFKMRRDMTKEFQLEDYGIKEGDKLEAIFDEKEIIEKVDFIGGVYSTFLYDVLYLDKPVCIFKTSMDYGEGMLKNSLAIELSLENLKEDLEKLSQNYEDNIVKNVVDFYRASKNIKNELQYIYSK